MEGDSTFQMAVLCFSAVLIGINKTGVPGLGLLPVILLAEVFEVRLATGIQLLMLCAADVMAVAYYRKHANWKVVATLLPWALCGIALGSLALRCLDDRWMRPALAVIILLMVGCSYLARFLKSRTEKLPDHWVFSAFFGTMGGLTTQVANAAGPVMAIYLLAMKLPKKEYMGCAAWFFLLINWIKLPVFVFEGRITMAAFWTILPMLPLLVLGAVLGILILAKIPQRAFEEVVQLLAAVAALKMLFF